MGPIYSYGRRSRPDAIQRAGKLLLSIIPAGSADMAYLFSSAECLTDTQLSPVSNGSTCNAKANCWEWMRACLEERGYGAEFAGKSVVAFSKWKEQL